MKLTKNERTRQRTRRSRCCRSTILRSCCVLISLGEVRWQNGVTAGYVQCPRMCIIGVTVPRECLLHELGQLIRREEELLWSPAWESDFQGTDMVHPPRRFVRWALCVILVVTVLTDSFLCRLSRAPLDLVCAATRAPQAPSQLVRSGARGALDVFW